MPDRDVFIISAARTASCGLRDWPPEDLAAAVLKESMRQAGVAPERLDDMLWAGPADEGFSMLRAARRAGIPADMPMLEINWGRADGLQAVISGAQAILAGDADIVIAGGKGQAFRSRQKEPGARSLTLHQSTSFLQKSRIRHFFLIDQ